MTSIKFSVVREPKASAKSKPVVVVGAAKVGNVVNLVGTDAFTADQLAALGVTGKAETVTRTLGADGRAYAILGLGKESPSANEWRELGGAMGRQLLEVAALEVRLPLEDITSGEALVQGIELGSYEIQGRPKKIKLETVTIVTELSIDKKRIGAAVLIAACQRATRDLAVAPANTVYPESVAKLAADLAEKTGVDIQVWDEKQLKKDKFGLIAAVGMGSARPPRLVKLTYSPKHATKHIALVGKGITFDTGGLAVKPLGGMLGMKYDMTGAATVLQAILAIANLGLPIKVTSYLCLAENMPSGTAMRPGDVFQARNGKTVEVTNPDAEGRLVLADGISAASEEHPDLIVDVATLTGAARVALGVRYTGLMGSAAGVAALEAAATDAGELVWEMPLATELRSALDSPVADLQNSKVGSTFGGMLVGGWFIHEFVGTRKDGSKLEWAHLDIAGPADNEGSAYGYTPHGPTGVMLRTLVSLAQQMSAD
ncbi:MAG: leucyl aminopeptidase [Actinomycetales bacterium]|nr:leucyl aminopeptidase [Actinomycetales bacterium]